MKTFINDRRVFDHMQVSEYCRCWNRYFFKYVLGLTSPEYPEAMKFGIMIHEALARWYQTGSVAEAKKAFVDCGEEHKYVENTIEFQAKSSPRTIENGLKHIELYCSIFEDDNFKATETELEHFVPLVAEHKIGNFASRKKPGKNIGLTIGDEIYYAVHVDAVGHLGNDLATFDNFCFMEHKSTSLWAGSPLLEVYTYTTQVKGYALAVQHKFNLKEPCPGLLDFVYLRTKKREDVTARFPLNFSQEQICSFKDRLCRTLGEMLCREHEIGPWALPTNERCSAWNRVCEYAGACSALPDVKMAKSYLERFRFVETDLPRLESVIQEPVDGKREPHTLYYRIEKESL